MPKISVVVISYNMTRELPRTIRTLSPHMQIGIDAAEYEIIVVDNGSTDPFPEFECRRWAPDLIVHHMENPTPSPAPAINKGIEIARGELVGVCIDGARMASPGLLAAALAASRVHPWPVIGTIAFHLGPDVQMRSVAAGYDRAAEDALLASSGWEEDGYRLFDISVFAGSSAKGWFTLPAETNALFLKSDHWRRLGGFDVAFEQPGGGLVNLDTWVRACSDPDDLVIMLLGESTFHQVHGGIATNAAVSPWPTFHDEYVRLRGKPFKAPEGTSLIFGRMNAHIIGSVRSSLPQLSV
jgi:glycosyltransferase involved in cell wall biosynthesis